MIKSQGDDHSVEVTLIYSRYYEFSKVCYARKVEMHEYFDLCNYIDLFVIDLQKEQLKKSLYLRRKLCEVFCIVF